MNGWTGDLKKGFFIGAGVMLAIVVLSMVFGKLT